jgi:Uma2 family endonuclease
MATPALHFVPVEQYLNTSYEPDCDYVDGELLERNVGERPHGLLEGLFFSVFNHNRKAWQLKAFPEVRVQVSVDRFRIPDVCVVRPGEGSTPVVRKPPVLCIEVLSKDDTVRALQQRIDDYLGMGVEAVWVIDPELRFAQVYTAASITRVTDSLTLPGTEVRISLQAIFAEMDDLLGDRL